MMAFRGSRMLAGLMLTVVAVVLGLAPSHSRALATSGRVFYVAPNGSDSYPGTPSLPWRTIKKATTTAVAGDTVYVRGGTYQEIVTLYRSGTERIPVGSVRLAQGNKATFDRPLAGVSEGDYLYVYRSWKSNNGAYRITEVGANYVLVRGAPFVDEAENVRASVATPIIFRRYPGETVTVQIGHADCRSPAVYFSHTQYVIVEGFRVTGSCHAGVGFTYSAHNVFRDGEVYGNDRPGIHLVDASAYNIIASNAIHDNGLNGPGEGVYIGVSPQDGGNDTSHYNHVIDNRIYGITTGDEGTDIKVGISHTVVEGNLYENNHSTWGVILLGPDAADTLVYGNTLRANSGGPRWAGCIYVKGPNNTIFDNLIYQTVGLNGMHVFRYPGNRIWHNTIAKANVGIEFDAEGPGTSGTEVKNNILSGNALQLSGETAGASIAYNLIFGPSHVYGSNVLKTDPRFVAASIGDYHLQALSPAIDAGVNLGVSTDLDGTSRPQGSGYDLGAYEYAGPPVEPPAPVVTWDAADGTITPPLTVVDGYVVQPIWVDDPSAGGRALYQFSLPTAGRYVLETIVDAPSEASNSFYVCIDGEPENPAMIWDIVPTSGFEERTVSWRGSGTAADNEFVPKVFTLVAGSHELIIRGREANTRLQRLSLEALGVPGPQTYLPLCLRSMSPFQSIQALIRTATRLFRALRAGSAETRAGAGQPDGDGRSSPSP